MLQAIQSSLKIVLGDRVHDRKVFKGMASFETHDFLRFEFDSKIFNLDFTNSFEQIY